MLNVAIPQVSDQSESVKKSMNEFWYFATFSGINERLTEIINKTQSDSVKRIAEKIEDTVSLVGADSNPTRVLDLTELSLCVSLLSEFDASGESYVWNDMIGRLNNVTRFND